MRHFIFLDMDDTFLYENSAINQALLDSLRTQCSSLRDQGVTQVCVFSNMDLQDLSFCGQDTAPTSRYEIIKLIEEYFPVHKVITSADPGYYDENGQLKPIGSAYDELYRPLMERVQNNGPLDLERYNSDRNDIFDYFQNRLRWDQAQTIAGERCHIDFTQTATLDYYPNLILINKKNPRERIALNADSLKAYLNDPELIAAYAIGDGNDVKKQIKLKGTAPTDNKGLMMQQAINELVERYGPIAITYFDDRETHIEGALEAAAPFVQAGLVSLSTCLMSKDFPTSQSAGMRVKYDQTIEQNVVLITKVEQLSEAIENIDKPNLGRKTRSNYLANIKENLNYVASTQMLKLASLAVTGSPVFDKIVSVKTAFKCLQIAYLKANSDAELLAVENALHYFLNRYSYSEINAPQKQDLQVANLLDNLQGIARTEITQSSLAKKLASRISSFTRLNLSHLNEGDVGYERTDNDLNYWNSLIEEANNHSNITISEIGQDSTYSAASSSSSSAPAMPACSSSTPASSTSSSSSSPSTSSSSSPSTSPSASPSTSPRASNASTILKWFGITRITTEVQEIADDENVPTRSL